MLSWKDGGKMKEVKNLNFDWLYKENCESDIKNILSSDEGFVEVDLPHTKELPLNYYDNSQMRLCYKTQLRVLPSMLKKELYLVCEGISQNAYIYIDEVLIYTNHNGYDQFKVNLTSTLTQLKDYTITIIADNIKYEDSPRLSDDRFCGIYREVYLEMTDTLKIEDVSVKGYDILNSDCVNFEIKVNGGTEINITIDGMSNDYEINNDQDVYPFIIKDKILWDLDNPHLYQATVKLYNGYNLIDVTYVTFGLRDIAFSNNEFYLNGKKVFLNGLERQESYPYVNKAVSMSLQKSDARILKEKLNVNLVYCPTTPSKYFLDECDRIGLMVIISIPGDRCIGNNKFKENTYQSITNMITLNKNRPSIIMWGSRIIGSVDDSEFYKRTNMLVHRLDDTRLTIGMRNHLNSEFLEDVYGYNISGEEYLTLELDKISYPLIIFNNVNKYQAKRYDINECYKQNVLISNILKSQKGKVCGVINSTMCDYASLSGDNINYSGVLDISRNLKISGYSYIINQDKYPVLETVVLDKKVVIYSNLDFVVVNYLDNSYTFDLRNVKVKSPLEFSGVVNEAPLKGLALSVKEVNEIKQIFNEAYNTSFNDKLRGKALKVLKKLKLSQKDIIDLYNEVTFLDVNKLTIASYKGNELIKTIKFTDETKAKYDVYLSSDEITLDSTYDTIKVDIFKKDQNGNVLLSSFDSLRVEVEGKIDVIGPKLISLSSGCQSFYVKSTTNRRKEKYLSTDKSEVLDPLCMLNIYDNYDNLIYQKQIKVILEK